MRAIDKFILHVVHNWKNKLNEAYSEGAIKAFIKKFSEEADDLNITISDEQLRKYIERFDTLKNSPKITEKDLNKYTISQLIKLVTSSPGAETPEDEEDRTPDVVYQEGGITIWNGSKEGNCITYGSGEKWCITRGSYGNYRYDSSRGYPTFYLAKNTNLSDSDRLSFVAIQVRDASDENRKYVYTNRKNDPYESSPMSFSTLMSEIPWLNDIPNIRSILKYIPLSGQEKASKIYERTSIGIREWIKLPFTTKKQYLVARKGKNLFKDVNGDDFVEKYLPKYPELANFVAVTSGIIDNMLLLKNLDKFNNQDRRSITANLRDKINTEYLTSDELSFDVKKLLVILDKWGILTNERLYITKDKNAIVKLKFGENISVGLYTEDADYPNIKLNQRTAKYLLDYPELDKLPFNSLLKLATDGVINKEFIDKVIEVAKSEENSAIIIKKVEDGEILIDANSFSSYKIKDDKITKIPFNDEEVQTALGDEKENTAFQQGAVNIIKDSVNNSENLPPTLDKDAFISIVKSTPYDKRTLTYPRRQAIILVPDGESQYSLFTRDINDNSNLYSVLTAYDYGRRGDWRDRNSNNGMDEGAWRAYFAYLRNENKVYEGSRIASWFRSSYGNFVVKKAWFIAQPPFSPTDQYAPAIGANGICYLVNKANPRESLKLSESGKMIGANIPVSLARQLTGATPDEATPAAPGAQPAAQPVVGAPRRGRPAGVQNVRAPQPAAPAAAAGDVNVEERMQEVGLDIAFLRLPNSVRRKLTQGPANRVNPDGDRGAARRNNMLGGAGRVGQVIEIGPSKIYIIRLANQQIIASINAQPGNINYILLGNEQGNIGIFLNSPSDLMSVLRQRNLAEVRNYIIQEYITNNPHHIGEVKKMIQKHIAETKNS